LIRKVIAAFMILSLTALSATECGSGKTDRPETAPEASAGLSETQAPSGDTSIPPEALTFPESFWGGTGVELPPDEIIP
jgi:hypothetical protein